MHHFLISLAASITLTAFLLLFTVGRQREADLKLSSFIMSLTLLVKREKIVEKLFLSWRELLIWFILALDFFWRSRSSNALMNHKRLKKSLDFFSQPFEQRMFDVSSSRKSWHFVKWFHFSRYFLNTFSSHVCCES